MREEPASFESNARYEKLLVSVAQIYARIDGECTRYCSARWHAALCDVCGQSVTYNILDTPSLQSNVRWTVDLSLFNYH